MSKSKSAKSSGLIPVRLPMFTVGPLGHNDAGHPDTPRWLLADTPGSLGMNDYADPTRRSGLRLIPDGNRLRLDPKFDTPSIQLNPWLMARVVFVTEHDEREFESLKGKITDVDVAEYVRHRNSFFGSTAEYDQFAAESDKELDETKNLRKLIELHDEAQTVFYRWVRKAYLDAGVSDVPKIIRAGKSEKLVEALSGVRAIYKGSFKAGGFNPRPKKIDGRYRLGTISEHATGMAIDIDDHSNPQFNASDWKFIEKLAGKTADLDLATWQKKPKDAWQSVRDVNDAFVEKIKSEVKRIEEERAKAAKADPKAAEKKKKDPEPLDVIFKDKPALKKWSKGFITLEWSLVEQLHDHDFTWGATFFSRSKGTGNVDLHHFELN